MTSLNKHSINSEGHVHMINVKFASIDKFAHSIFIHKDRQFMQLHNIMFTCPITIDIIAIL